MAPQISGTVAGSAAVAILGLFMVLAQQTGLRLPAPGEATVVEIAPENRPLPSPLTGVWEPNHALADAVRLFDGQLVGAESIAVHPDGWLALGDKFGDIWRADALPGGNFSLAARPLVRVEGGRPLGLHFDAAGDLLICSAPGGLLKLDVGARALRVLTARTSHSGPHAPATPVRYANDLALAADGTIYFTDSSPIAPPRAPDGSFSTFWACILALAQGGMDGRLLSFSPATGRTEVVSRGFLYANGVALSKDGAWAAVAETGAYRVWRVWLRGARAGEREPLVERLPGYPDGVALAADGRSFWVALVLPPTILTKAMHSRLLRWAVAWAPNFLRRAVHWGMVVQVSEEGAVLRTFMDPTGEHIRTVSSVVDTGPRLLLGNLMGSYVSYLPLPRAA